MDQAEGGLRCRACGSGGLSLLMRSPIAESRECGSCHSVENHVLVDPGHAYDESYFRRNYDPVSGEQVSVKMGRFGPVAQIGDSGNGGKPRFASLTRNQLIETITLEEALDLFKLPRSLGSQEGEEIVAGIGRFGPYIRYRNKFYSLKKGVDDPHSVTLERAITIIKEKNESDQKKVIKDFGDIKVLNGRYGPYLTQEKENYRLPKGTSADQLTREDCIAIIEKSRKTKK